MDQSQLNRVLDLAAKTGRLYVASDVYAQLKPHLDSDGRLRGIVIVESRLLEPGVMLAVDAPAISRLAGLSLEDWPSRPVTS